MTIRQKIILHSLVAKHSTMAIDLEIAKQLKFDGLEASGAKISECLAGGVSKTSLREMVDGMWIPGIGFLVDIERQDGERPQLFSDAARLFELAATVGAKGVEVITGPLSLEAVRSKAPRNGLYRGLLDRPEQEQIDLTAANLRELADNAASHGLILYLESLSWTPLNTIDKQLKVIEKVGRSNLKLLIDYWHCYTSGDTPERVAKIDKDLIYGVHVCDSLEFKGGIPDEPVLRDVPTGEGVLNLQEWTDAVKSTGYEGWWSCELFCNRNHQQNSFEVAGQLKSLMQSLIG
ncbi:Sugar phosphate isomerase/epimerase [Rhizobium aethiopicum]|uniref:Sugar phosphate isomerase/epimerase n=1 Tax=Rhizobium aethiopicum TaxID=1138170 RepID=A0A1C3Y2C7_9HYPH|nr:sugar phosphate isomerase/epimerase family protein [Rhizobium aethiopicum]SCB58623.1 Sugar phosphate isomerase/epimerase [Rhizobium aethiopicum]